MMKDSDAYFLQPSDGSADCRGKKFRNFQMYASGVSRRVRCSVSLPEAEQEFHVVSHGSPNLCRAGKSLTTAS